MKLIGSPAQDARHAQYVVCETRRQQGTGMKVPHLAGGKCKACQVRLRLSRSFKSFVQVTLRILGNSLGSGFRVSGLGLYGNTSSMGSQV